MEIKKITVKENNKEMNVFIPQSDDHSYNEYLAEAETEKTRDQLRKKPDKPVSKISKKDRAEALKEIKEYSERKRSEHPRKFF